MKTSSRPRRIHYRDISPTFWAGSAAAAALIVGALVWLLTHGPTG